MTEREPLPPINFAALADALLGRAETLVPQWLPGGKTSNGEYLTHSVWRSEKTASLSVCLSGDNAGKWADFGGDHRGNDLISLYASIHGMTMGKAAVELAVAHGLEDVANVVKGRDGAQPTPRPAPPPVEPSAAAPVPKSDEGWRTNIPVPDTAPAATFKHQYRKPEDIEHLATYSKDGLLLGYVVRFKTSEGGKETLPYTWCTSARDGASRWHWKQWDEPRPLYFPGGVSPGQCLVDGKPVPTVIVVEGEKKAGILQDLLDAHAPGIYLVVSWPGGCKAWKKVLWEWLAGCTVLLWPDCDGKRELLTKKERDACLDEAALDIAQAMKPLIPAHKQGGMAAMLGIGALLRDTLSCTVQLLPIPEPLAVPDGWDCADAIQTDGWDGERVLAFFGRAQPLPVSEGDKTPAAASGGGGGKKIDGPAGAGDAEDAQPPSGKPLPWWLAPYWDSDKARWYTSRKLVIAALKHDTMLEGVLGLNELTNNIDARRAWPWAHGKEGPITGSTDLMLGQYLTEVYGLPSIARAALQEAMETVAHTNRFHPVREYLLGLQHDGVSRIDKWLVYVIGETPQSLPPQMMEYLSLVGRFLLLGMVNRVMEPGCKFDYCPVLEGPGGLGKSTFVQVLASKAFFSGAHFDLQRGKDGQEQVQGVWVYELQELSNFGKAEINLIKAFISNEVDRYRPSYGKVVEAFLRQCVLVGTTNEDRYLRDRTGNRRWWPTPVRHVINVAWLTKMRDQLLAEAFALYLKGTPYTPTREQEARLFVPMQESRLEETAVQSELLQVLTRAPQATGLASEVNNLTDFVTNAKLVSALGVDAAKSGPALVREIGSWMKNEGWLQKKRTINGARVLGYERPAKGWPNAPLDIPGRPAEDDWTAGLGDKQTSTAANAAALSNHQYKGDDHAPF